MFESPSELECLIDKRGQTHSELFERPTFYLQAIMIIALLSAFPNQNDEICNYFSDYIEGFQKKKTVDTVEPASIMKRTSALPSPTAWLSGGMADAGDLKSLALNGRAGSSPALAI